MAGSVITEPHGKPFETDAMMQLLRDIHSARTAARVLLFFWLVFVIRFHPAHALDPGRDADEYIIRTWSVGEGLPQNSVTAIVQTRDGYVWLGTYSGLVRFDGVSFEILNRWNTPGLKNDRISTLYEDGEGTLWVGTYGGGLSGLRAGEWQAHTTREGLSNDYVTCLLRDRGGTLWIGTEDGLNRLAGEEIAAFSTWHGLAGNSITSLVEDAGGRLLIGTLDGGVSVLEDPASDDFKPYADVAVRVVNALAAGAKGQLYIGALKGLDVIYNGEVRHYSREDGLSSNSVSALLASENGDVWVGLVAGGLEVLRNGEFMNLAEEAGFPDDPVHALLEDRDGSIWAGTDTRGLVQIKDPVVEVITTRDGLTDGEIRAVLEDREGNLWVGTGGNGLCQVRDGRVISVHNTMTGLPSSRIRCLLDAGSGAVWVGTEGGGLSRLSDGAVTTLTTRDGLSSNDVTALLEDGSGTLWIGTARGLNRLKDGRIRAYDRTTNLGGAYIRTLLENDRGILHVGTREGLIKFYDRTPLPLYINEDGIEPDVLSIHEDSGGVLWIGTAGNGLIRYEENEVVAYTTREGLFDNHIFSIAEDAAGDFWFGSYVGVFRIRREQLDALRTGAISRLTPALYDEAEGLRNRQCTFEGEPSACGGGDGRLYFPTIEGVAVFDPEGLDEAGSPPRAIIEGMVADNVPVPETDSHLSGRPLVVQFRFTALDFLAPCKVRFEYRLEGFDEDWNRLGPDSPRTAYYFNLEPGEYVFRVRAAGNRGIWDEAGASFGFRIVKPFYRRPHLYAIVLGAIAVGAGAYAASRRKKQTRPEKYSTSALPDERVEEVLPKLERLMEKDKVFLDAELNLQQLARKVGIHYNYLSRIINEKFGLSYNDYVNGYRIQEARRMLADPEHAEKTILDIAYDTGFYSKSVFNTAFKKITGMTPSQYRKQCKKH
jgi:ligand-binding sensor domain-containing protein/AraC-like DNA-binding protein